MTDATPSHHDDDPCADDGPLDRPIDVTGTHSRREFLRRVGLVAAGTGVGIATPWAMELASFATASGEAAGAAPGSDGYRALVCVFLYGGNDQWNTFIPNDAEGHAAYAAGRSGIARGRDEILPISPVDGFAGAGSFGFAPELSRLRALFDGGDAAVVANVGTLVTPLDKAAYASGGPRPPQLFSHNDQQSYWQAGAVEGARTGWGGRIADFLLDGNGEHSLFTSVSAAGNAIMMSGRNALQYQVSSRGVTTLRTDQFSSDAIDIGLRDVMAMQRPGLFPSAYTDTTRRGLVAADDLAAAISEATDSLDLGAHFRTDAATGPLSNLSGQMEIVARLIAAGRNVLGLKRQVFFVGLGGFDNHSRLMADHLPLLQALDHGLAGFHAATTALGVADRVTTFTASDFGRSLLSNGDGTDHGWGGHHLVIGGSVRGNRVIGTVPRIGDDGPDDVGQGRLLPTIAVDQYAATMGRWLGVGEGDLGAVAPNLGNFAAPDLGLFDPGSIPTPVPRPPDPAPTTTSVPVTTPGTSTVPDHCPVPPTQATGG
ncbi:MAG: DUF1501 domain-containing protein [Actinomycetota bacterium]